MTMSTIAAGSAAGRGSSQVRPAVVIPGRYLSLTSYRRDGSGVSTPVWFVQRDGLILVQTDAWSYKVKRIQRNPAVTISPCTASGRLRGQPRPATARLLPVGETDRAEPLFLRKYRHDVLILRPLRAIQAALRMGRPRGGPVIVEITPG